MPLTEHQATCQAHIAAAKKANMPIAAYARANQIPIHRLYSELARQAKAARKVKTAPTTRVAKPPSFVRIEPQVQPVTTSLLQIRLPNGVSLALPSDQKPLDEVLKTLVAL